MLIDCNRSPSLKGIDLPKLPTDALPKRGGLLPVLDAFVNTHPHNDHLCGLDEIGKVVRVSSV
jgi:glyoxylase-like metal-dependent hydrolase (beta-lactamase superfamily II)